jgi:antitoxin VapB
MRSIMRQVAKLFTNGRSQAVRLPAAFRFDTREVFIRQDPTTGDVILSRKPDDWAEFRELLSSTEVPDEFLSPAERAQGEQTRDPLEGMGA